MFCALADAGKLEFVNSVVENLVECKCECALKCSGRRHSCSERNVTGENCVESLDLSASLDGLSANSEHISCPTLNRCVLLPESEFAVLVEIKCESLHLVGAVEPDFRHNSLVNGAREHESSVVVGVFTDEIDTSG